MGDSAHSNGNEKSNEDNIKEQEKLSLMRAYVECHDPSSKDCTSRMVIGASERRDGLYYFQSRPCLTAIKVEKESSLELWHARMGHPSTKEVDDLMLRRFLRARNLDLEKSSSLFLKYLKWKRTFVPKGYISEIEIQNEIAQNKAFHGGIDKQGRPIILVFGARHFQNTNIHEFKRFAVYALDKLCSRMLAGQERFLGIGDLQGWGYKNCDIRGYLSALSIMQDCYPERLGKLLIVHAPRIFMTAWKIVYPFIDNKTKTKIAFVDNTKLKSTLLEDIDESQLPDVYGGQLPLMPIQDA